MFEKGSFVTINDCTGVVICTGQELLEEIGADLDDHTGIWFGSLEGGGPVIRTIPTEYLQEGPHPRFKH